MSKQPFRFVTEVEGEPVEFSLTPEEAEEAERLGCLSDETKAKLYDRVKGLFQEALDRKRRRAN